MHFSQVMVLLSLLLTVTAAPVPVPVPGNDTPAKTPPKKAAKPAKASSSKSTAGQTGPTAEVYRGSTHGVGGDVLAGNPVKPKGSYHPDGPKHLETPFETMKSHVETDQRLGPNNERTPLISTSESKKEANKFVNKNQERRKSGTFLTIDKEKLDPPPTTRVNQAYEDHGLKNKYANQQEVSVAGEIPSNTIKKVEVISKGARTSIDNPNYKPPTPPSGSS